MDNIKPAFIRLFDAKHHWHKVIDGYFEPREFRVAVNSCIQELRNVTFVLQANKRGIQGFDEWYKPWQERMKANPSLRWLVDSRNYIVKQGDLELLSKLRIEVIGSYIEDETVIFEEDFNPSLTNKEIYAKTISLGLPEDVFQNSYVRLQRRWIDKKYPDYELGDLLSECWSALAELLFDTPNLDEHLIPRSGTSKLPPCMHEQLEMRAILMKVHEKTLVPAVMHSEHVSLNNKEKEVLIEEMHDKYADAPLFSGDGDNLASKSFKEQCELFFEQAKYMLQKDGYHIHLAMLFVGRNFAQTIEIRNEDKADKFITMRNLANMMKRIGADSFIMISEAWSTQFDMTNPFVSSAELSLRQETLVLIAATNDGESYCYSIPFLRDGDQISFKDQKVQIMNASEMNIIQPIFAMWSGDKN